MNHLIHNGVDYVIWKQTTDTIECVTKDGEIVKFSPGDPQISNRYYHDLPIEPCALPFDQRPSSFVEELQLRRVAYLRENQSKKRTDKGPRASSNGTRKRSPSGTGKKKSKTDQLIQQMASQKLAAAGITNPVALEAIRKLMGG